MQNMKEVSLRITGNKLDLRDMGYKDLELIQYWVQPSHEWHKLNGPYYPPASTDEISEIISNYAKSIASDVQRTPRRRLMIVDKNDNSIGTVSRYWISEETNWTAIGISIWNPENWGKGYGYDSLGLWCAYLFASESKFVRLDLRTWSGNHGMMKLAERLGFKQEAVFRKARIVDGKYYDGLGYGILREEWAELYSGISGLPSD